MTTSNITIATTGFNEVTTAQQNTSDDKEPYGNQIVGRCPNIPSGIHVDVFYSETGLTDAHPIYEITGTRIG